MWEMRASRKRRDLKRIVLGDLPLLARAGWLPPWNVQFWINGRGTKIYAEHHANRAAWQWVQGRWQRVYWLDWLPIKWCPWWPARWYGGPNGRFVG